MADINKLKDKIRSTIYPNGKGAINASEHQALLLDMADGMAETDTKLAKLSEKIKGVSDEIFGFQPISAEIKSTGANVLCQLNLKANETYKIHLLLAEDVQSLVFPRLWDLDGNQLTDGTMSSGKEFDIEYTPTEDIVANLMLNIGNLTYLVNTICVVTIKAGVTLSEEVGMLSEELTSLSDNVTKVSEETTQIINDFYGRKTLTGAITQTFSNTIASFNLDGGVKYSIKLTFASAVVNAIYPRLYSLSGQSLTSGTMAAGLTEFVIEYTPSEDMEVELRVNIGGSNPNLVKTQVQIVIETGVSILERLEKVEGSTQYQFVINKTITI